MKLQAFVPLVTHTDPNSDAIAANAVAAAGWLGASIHALAINADIPEVSNALSRLLLNVPEMIREAEAISRRSGEHLLKLIEEKGAEAGIEVWHATMSGTPALLTAEAAIRARYHDISLVGWEKDNPTSRATAESVVFGSGRPALLLPEAVEAGAFEHVAVAWDGSRVAARALADAQPFLARATRVSVLTAVDEKPIARDVGERLAKGLEKRGLKADAVPLRAEGRAVAQTLQSSAVERGCGLLVMGAFGHSRMRDFVLGGATEGMLADMKLPVLLSH